MEDGMSRSRIIGAALGALMGIGGAIALPSQPAISTPSGIVQRRSKRQVLRDIGGVSRWNYPGHPGTVAQAKRAATKARNRARHRAACRG
jgi:hypothetical protein